MLGWSVSPPTSASRQPLGRTDASIITKVYHKTKRSTTSVRALTVLVALYITYITVIYNLGYTALKIVKFPSVDVQIPQRGDTEPCQWIVIVGPGEAQVILTGSIVSLSG